ncbi:mitotic checkpoint regulator, MAD2B-interacting-domain-containing protein [Desarmillaria ectypa]|nr:mitotic checkpoint regulator, MAD2B-interacting-domain-containing protein [Desarmillaria ectypa]
MLGLEDYGSGSESDGETETKPQTSSSTNSQSLKPQFKTTSSSIITLPPPRTKKRIAIALPSLKSVKDDDEETEIPRPVAKKPRLESGAGASSLMSMLPAPKQKNPVPAPTERVLGGGMGQALSFNVPPSAPPADEVESKAPAPSIPFLPPSLAKGRSNISLEEDRPTARPAARTAPAPALDFFSLGAPSTPKPTDSTATSSSSSISISSAPAIPTFEPPEPTMNDEYPGYYQLPSGVWKAYEPEYYANVLKRWQKEYNDQVRALEKGVAKGFKGMDKEGMEDVDAKKEMDRAKKEIKEREERKAITKGAGGAPEKPKMTINASKLSGIARSRHQLSTMLKEAYENREALEEKIAEGRRNRKEAGNKVLIYSLMIHIHTSV